MNSVHFFGLPIARCFAVRLRSFLRPGLCGLHCVARSGGQDWPQATAEAARSGLDGREHGASLDQAGYRPAAKIAARALCRSDRSDGLLPVNFYLA